MSQNFFFFFFWAMLQIVLFAVIVLSIFYIKFLLRKKIIKSLLKNYLSQANITSNVKVMQLEQKKKWCKCGFMLFNISKHALSQAQF